MKPNFFQRVMLFIFGRPHISTELRICFHKEAIYFGEHGSINVSNKKLGIVEQDVVFVFVGVTTPPVLDLTTYIRIWEEAKAQGYIPHHISQYGKNNEVFDTSRIEDNIVSVSANTIAARNNVQAIKNASNILDGNGLAAALSLKPLPPYGRVTGEHTHR